MWGCNADDEIRKFQRLIKSDSGDRRDLLGVLHVWGVAIAASQRCVMTKPRRSMEYEPKG